MTKEHRDLVVSWRVELWRLARLVPWSLYPRVPLGGAQGGGRLHLLHHHHHVSLNTMMKVFSGPPNVVFTWRHWGHLEGSFQDNQVGGILHHVASRSNLKSARAQRFPTLNGNYSNSHLEHDFPTHTEAHCHFKQSGHIQESWRVMVLCLEVLINLLARQSSIWSVLSSLNADIYLLNYRRATVKKLRCLDSAGAFFSQSQPFHQLLSLRIGLNEDLKVQRMEIFYDPETFIKVVIFFHPCHIPYYVSD